MAWKGVVLQSISGVELLLTLAFYIVAHFVMELPLGKMRPKMIALMVVSVISQTMQLIWLFVPNEYFDSFHLMAFYLFIVLTVSSELDFFALIKSLNSGVTEKHLQYARIVIWVSLAANELTLFLTALELLGVNLGFDMAQYQILFQIECAIVSLVIDNVLFCYTLYLLSKHIGQTQKSDVSTLHFRRLFYLSMVSVLIDWTAFGMFIVSALVGSANTDLSHTLGASATLVFQWHGVAFTIIFNLVLKVTFPKTMQKLSDKKIKKEYQLPDADQTTPMESTKPSESQPTEYIIQTVKLQDLKVAVDN
jgi:hypothetical protein